MTSKSWETRRKNGWKPSSLSRRRMSEAAKKRCGSPEDRFWRQTAATLSGGCWEWLGARDAGGYGQIVTDGVSEKSHRFSWKFHNGDIPEGLFVCHHCDNPGCVNPDHLFLGTCADNIRDASQKGRLATGDNLTPTGRKSISDKAKNRWKQVDRKTIKRTADGKFTGKGGLAK